MMIGRKKRFKFEVELTLDELTEVAISKATLLAKVRQLDGGSFTSVSEKTEVQNHSVRWDNNVFKFPAKMTANASSGVLEACKCRVSVRMEERSGRHFKKLGYVDVNLSEYAGAGPSTQRYILQAYDSSHRMDNSMIQLSLNITLVEGDIIFSRPMTRKEPILLPGEEARRKSKAFTSSNSGTSSRVSSRDGGEASDGDGQAGSGPELQHTPDTVIHDQGSLSLAGLSLPPHPQTTSDDLSDHVSNFQESRDVLSMLGHHHGHTTDVHHSHYPEPINHSRNSSQGSNQSGSGMGGSASTAATSGGGTMGERGHSRQSSSGGESCHGRNLSQGSSTDTGIGSLEKRSGGKGGHNPLRDIGVGRVDANDVINELLEGVDFRKPNDHDCQAAATGLTLELVEQKWNSQEKSSRASVIGGSGPR